MFTKIFKKIITYHDHYQRNPKNSRKNPRDFSRKVAFGQAGNYCRTFMDNRLILTDDYLFS